MGVRTEEILKNAGWYTGRQVDISGYERLYRQRGYEMWPVLAEFLREFGGVTASYEWPTKGDESWFEINPAEGLSGTDSSEIARCARTVGEPLTPFGLQDSVTTLMMSPSGKVYGTMDGYLGLYGNSGEEALDCLCGERNLIPLRDPRR